MIAVTNGDFFINKWREIFSNASPGEWLIFHTSLHNQDFIIYAPNI